MLTETERQAIREAELLKAEIRKEIDEAREANAPPQSWFARKAGDDNLRWVLASIVIPLVVFTWGHFESANTREEAEVEKLRIAEATKLQEQIALGHRNTDLIIRLLPDINAGADTIQFTNALAVMSMLEAESQLPPALAATFKGNVERLNKQGTKGNFSIVESRIQVETIARSVPAIRSDQIEAGASPKDSVVTAARVYIQYYTENQRALAEKLQSRLREKGFAVPGLENVTSTALARGKEAPSNYSANDIRYFKSADASTSEQVAGIAKTMGLDLKVKDLSGQRSKAGRLVFQNVPLGQIEVWLAPDSAGP